MKVGLGTLTIANGGTDSEALTFANLRFIRSITIEAPDTLTGTVTVQVSGERSGTDFTTLQSDGSDITIAASDAITIDPITAMQLRLHSGSAETGDRTFRVTGMEC